MNGTVPTFRESILLLTLAMSSNDDAVTVIGVIIIVLDILTVASRFYSRWSAKAGFGWDDWTILIALVTGILPGILTVWGLSSLFHAVGSAAYMLGAWRRLTPISEHHIRDGARRCEQL